jgi:hypothetical protein
VSEGENPVCIRKAGGVGFDGIQAREDLRHNGNNPRDAAGRTRPRGCVGQRLHRPPG